MRSFWDRLEIWLRSWASKPAKAMESAETPLAVNHNSSEPAKGGPMETTFENLVEFFETEGLMYDARPEGGVVIASFRCRTCRSASISC